MKIEAKEHGELWLALAAAEVTDDRQPSLDTACGLLRHIAWQNLRLIEARADRDAHAVRAQEQAERVTALEVERELLRAQSAAMMAALGKLENQVAEAIFGLGASS